VPNGKKTRWAPLQSGRTEGRSEEKRGVVKQREVETIKSERDLLEKGHDPPLMKD